MSFSEYRDLKESESAIPEQILSVAGARTSHVLGVMVGVGSVGGVAGKTGEHPLRGVWVLEGCVELQTPRNGASSIPWHKYAPRNLSKLFLKHCCQRF